MMSRLVCHKDSKPDVCVGGWGGGGERSWKNVVQEFTARVTPTEVVLSTLTGVYRCVCSSNHHSCAVW